jgi:Zn-dependent membrane protease YugP
VEIPPVVYPCICLRMTGLFVVWRYYELSSKMVMYRFLCEHKYSTHLVKSGIAVLNGKFMFNVITVPTVFQNGYTILHSLQQ